jgi:hypothetical protein
MASFMRSIIVCSAREISDRAGMVASAITFFLDTILLDRTVVDTASPIACNRSGTPTVHARTVRFAEISARLGVQSVRSFARALSYSQLITRQRPRDLPKASDTPA